MKKKCDAKLEIRVNDWVEIRAGELRGAAGQVRSIHEGVATLRQLNGNEVRQPVSRLKFGEYDPTEPDGLQ